MHISGYIVILMTNTLYYSVSHADTSGLQNQASQLAHHD